MHSVNISDEVIELETKLIEHKSFFNSNPEIGFEEYKTSQYIARRLTQLGYEVKSEVAKTGIIAILRGESEHPCIMFRADMDAVAMKNGDKITAKHTCGHDAHMACLLTFAELLVKNRKKIKGTVKLVFQPGEEGYGGAKIMIEEGVLNYPEVDKCFALHMWSELPYLHTCIKDGPLMASGDEFEIEIYGKQGHAALPERCVDPVYIASTIVVALQSIVSRNIPPDETAVISVTSIIAANSYNVIGDKAVLKGTVRTYNNQIREYIAERMKKIAESIAEGLGGKATVQYRYKHSALINTKEEADVVRKIAEEVLALDYIITNYKTMCTEDFSHFLEKVSGAFVLIGCCKNKDITQHNENFYVEKDAILLATELLCRIAKVYLW